MAHELHLRKTEVTLLRVWSDVELTKAIEYDT
jgi:hypothetical protein